MAGTDLSIKGLASDPGLNVQIQPAAQVVLSSSLRQPEARSKDEPTPRAADFTKEEIASIAGNFGEVVGLINRGVRVEIDTDSHRVITQIVDRNTNKVIRQIPPEELLTVARRLREFVGLLLDEQS